MSNNPADVVNEALDAAGVNFTIGEINEGTRAADAALRKYGQCLRQLLRSVHWDFARKVAPITMLADATGQTANVGTAVPQPWAYEYAYPEDCMKARFLPANYLNQSAGVPGNISLPTTPLTTGGTSSATGIGMRLIPAPFLISLDSNYPVDPHSNWDETQGSSPGGRIVVLSNINQAQLVYTAFMPYPSVWDAQFRAAMVAFLAAEIALPLAEDKKVGMAMRKDNMAIAKQRVTAARVTNGNESAFPQTTDHLPDWMAARNSRNPGGNGMGLNNCGSWGADGFGSNGFGFMGYGFDQSIF